MHELSDAVESLTYWRGRARRLPWYRFGARREARELAQRWEARVTRAVLSERGVPLRLRVTAGLVVAQARVGRVHLRRWLIGATAVATAIVVVPLVLTVLALSQLF